MTTSTLKKSLFLAKSSLLMKLVGWGLFPFLGILTLIFPEGFLWDMHKGAHWSPYAFMMLSLYLAWCILLIRGANDPENNVLLFDWAILGNLLHALLMLFQALFLEHELQHLWGDVPVLFILTYILWHFSPRRVDL